MSTSTRRPSSNSRTIDGRKRLSRGSVERQTRAVAADHRHAVRRPGAEEQHAHESRMLASERPLVMAKPPHGEAGWTRRADVRARSARRSRASSVARHGDAALRRAAVRGIASRRTRRCGRSCSKKPTRRSTRSTAATSRARRRAGRRAVPMRLSRADRRRRTGRFDIADAVRDDHPTSSIRRHPHVFTPTGRPLGHARRTSSGSPTPAAVLEQWEKLKARSRTDAGREAVACSPACRGRCRRCFARTRSARASRRSASTGRKPVT